MYLQVRSFVERLLTITRSLTFYTHTQEFSTHENIVRLLNVIKADNNKDIYLVFDHMGLRHVLTSLDTAHHASTDTDLHVAIQGKLLQDVHHRYIMYQLFKVSLSFVFVLSFV